MPHGNITYAWRKSFTNREIHVLHAAEFETRLFDEPEWDWVDQAHRYSLGWVVARDGDRFIGFVNVLWDGLVHASSKTSWLTPTTANAASASLSSALLAKAHALLGASSCTSASRRTSGPSTSTPADSSPRSEGSWNGRNCVQSIGWPLAVVPIGGGPF